MVATQIVIIAVTVLFLYLLTRGLVTGFNALTGAKYRAFKQLAARYRGKYEPRGLSDPPTVSFAYNGSNVRVGLAPVVPGQVNPPRTRVVARFAAGLPFRCEVFPFGRQSPAQPPRGTRLVRSGHAEFDRAFVVQSNDPEVAADFLMPRQVRAAVESLRLQCPPAGMLVSINPERLLVQVDRNLGGSTVALESAVRDALILHDYLKASVSDRAAQGIAIVAVGPSADEAAAPPVCKVCGEPIEEAHVICSDCQTPHHRDCWAFVGSCSIFGCQSKRSIPA